MKSAIADPRPHASAISPRPLLALRNATFRLGDRLIFHNTTWSFNRHEHWTVLGPNGSGKSLFADCIRGRLPLVEGEITFGFKPGAGLTPEGVIGFVSFDERRKETREAVVQSRWNSIEEDTGLKVKDYLAYERVMEINPFEVRQDDQRMRSDFEKRKAAALRLLDTTKFEQQMVLNLSNGERQRLELTRALCHPLRLLILDEPFAGLDTIGRTQFHKTLQRLMRAKIRIMILTTREQDLPNAISHALWIEDCAIKHRVSRSNVNKWARTVRTHAHSRKRPKPRVTFESPSGRRHANHSQSIIELSNVNIRYGNKIILKNFHWTVREKDSWALLGPNGSGKTTLLSLIAGDNPQAYGNKVKVFGHQRGDGESIWDLKTRIGWLSPELHLHFDLNLTCLEAVISGFFESNGLFESPTPNQQRASMHWLKYFRISRFAHTPLFAVSAGFQRMTLLARSLVKAPRLLLLDEPCQGLDLEHRTLFIETIDRLVRRRTATVIYVTHREDETPPSIKRILRLGRA